LLTIPYIGQNTQYDPKSTGRSAAQLLQSDQHDFLSGFLRTSHGRPRRQPGTFPELRRS
jgi:hypothetical protein